jgi:signal transduction histidine kinase
VAIEQAVVSERVLGEGRHNRSLEELASAIAHEIRNPIAAAKSLVQQMSEDPASPDNAEYARVAVEELDRVERSVAHLLRFARDEELAPRSMLLTDAVSSALDTLRDRIADARVVIQREMDTEGALRGDPEKLRRVVINLVHNAVDALATAPEPRVIRVGVGENLAGNEVWLRVRDNGPGIPGDRLESVFKPFASTKASGTGLGLAVTKKIVEAHGGTIEVRSTAGDGAEFVVTLPKGRV